VKCGKKKSRTAEGGLRFKHQSLREATTSASAGKKREKTFLSCDGKKDRKGLKRLTKYCAERKIDMGGREVTHLHDNDISTVLFERRINSCIDKGGGGKNASLSQKLAHKGRIWVRESLSQEKDETGDLSFT